MKPMQRPWKVALATVMNGLLVSGHLCWAQDAEFAAALDAAKKAAVTDPLKSYLEGPFNQIFGQRYIGWINQCTTKTNASWEDLIEILLTVGPKGTVEAVRYEPHSALTECFI